MQVAGFVEDVAGGDFAGQVVEEIAFEGAGGGGGFRRAGRWEIGWCMRC